jgi:DNA polymerase-3 subunit epsilon
MTAVHEAVPVRQCTERLSPRRRRSPCALAEMGRCGAPCAGGETVPEYGRHVEQVREAFARDPSPLVDRLLDRIGTLAARERYEEAAVHRDRLAAFVRAAARCQRMSALASIPDLAAARARDEGGWEMHVVRYGRLAAAGTSPPGAHPRPYLNALVATAEAVGPAPAPLPAATVEETECVLRWLEQPGTRLVEIDGTWVLPARGAAAFTHLVGG